MQVSKSIGVLLVASLGHFSLTQAQEISIRPLPTYATPQQAKTDVLAVAVPVAGTANPFKPEALAVPNAPTAAPIAAALPIQQIWTLTAGVTIKENLEAWAEKAQWRVIWPKTLKTWVVPNETSFTGSFADAAEKVISTLAENGALVRIGTFEGNKTIVISGPGQAQQ
jgi:hypothetical protein